MDPSTGAEDPTVALGALKIGIQGQEAHVRTHEGPQWTNILKAYLGSPCHVAATHSRALPYNEVKEYTSSLEQRGPDTHRTRD